MLMISMIDYLWFMIHDMSDLIAEWIAFYWCNQVEDEWYDIRWPRGNKINHIRFELDANMFCGDSN